MRNERKTQAPRAVPGVIRIRLSGVCCCPCDLLAHDRAPARTPVGARPRSPPSEALFVSRTDFRREHIRRAVVGAVFKNRDAREEMFVREMISSHPGVHGRSADALLRCIEQCYSCAQTCTSCADACLGESSPTELVQCIRLNLDCADICAATGSVASRRTGTNMDVVHSLISTCTDACRACAAECAGHAEMHEHCRICAEACRACADSCLEALPLMH